MNKVYIVSYNDYAYDTTENLGVFSTEKKAEKFIEDCKNRFYVGDSIVIHDYSNMDLTIDEWNLDELDNRKIKI